jgi:carbon monoxide dehydrogenase subunit G
MARVVRRRRITAPAGALWGVIADPYHLPRWWPNTQRVESVTDDDPDGTTWTQVLETRPRNGDTEVTITLDRRLRGLSRLGAWMMRRATKRQLDQALTDLEAIAAGTS